MKEDYDGQKNQTREKPQVNDSESVTFRTDELICYGVLDYEGNEMMAAITGYDLEVRFNMRIINSLADAESCANALVDVFYQALMKQLIARNGSIIKPEEPE